MLVHGVDDTRHAEVVGEGPTVHGVDIGHPFGIGPLFGEDLSLVEDGPFTRERFAEVLQKQTA